MGRLINYTKIIKTHLINAFKEILENLANNTENNANFVALYICFDSKCQGVVFPEAYKTESLITIVLQYKYWNLQIHDTSFEVLLDFFGEKQTVNIPFNSIVAFEDKINGFGLDLSKVQDISMGSHMNEDEEMDNVISVDFF